MQTLKKQALAERGKLHLKPLSKTDRQWILRDTAEKVFFDKVS